VLVFTVFTAVANRSVLAFAIGASLGFLVGALQNQALVGMHGAGSKKGNPLLLLGLSDKMLSLMTLLGASLYCERLRHY
jgi:hypothetical protein